jgi:hypothetical protein
MQQRSCEGQTEEWLQQLQLADGSDAALGKAAIPEHETDQHAEERHIGEAKPGRPLDAGKGRRHGENQQRDHQRKRQDQRPGDHLPAAKRAGQPGAFGIAEPANDDGSEHQGIADRGSRQPLHEREAGHQCAAERGEYPECGFWPLAATQHAEDRRR